MQLDPNVPKTDTPGEPNLPTPPDKGWKGYIGDLAGKALTQLSQLGESAYQLRPWASRRVSVENRQSSSELIQLRQNIEKEFGRASLRKSLLERIDNLPPKLYPILLEGIKRPMIPGFEFLEKVERMLTLCDVAIVTNFIPPSLDQFISPDFFDDILKIDFYSLIDPSEFTQQKKEELCRFIGNIIEITRNYSLLKGPKKENIKAFIQQFCTDMYYQPVLKQGYEFLVSLILKQDVTIDNDLIYFLKNSQFKGTILNNFEKPEVRAFLEKNKFKFTPPIVRECIDEVRKERLLMDPGTVPIDRLNLKQLIANPYRDRNFKLVKIIDYIKRNTLLFSDKEFLKYLKDKFFDECTEKEQIDFVEAFKYSPHTRLLTLFETFSKLSFQTRFDLVLESIRDLSFLGLEEALSKNLLVDPKITKNEIILFINKCKSRNDSKFLGILLQNTQLFVGPKALFSHEDLLNILRTGMEMGLVFSPLIPQFVEVTHITKGEYIGIIFDASRNSNFDVGLASLKKESGSSVFEFTSSEKIGIIYTALKNNIDAQVFGPHRVFSDEGGPKAYFKRFIDELPEEVRKIDSSLFEGIASKSPADTEKANSLMDGLKLYCFRPDLPLPEIPESAKNYILMKRPALGLFLFPDVFVKNPERLQTVTAAYREMNSLIEQAKENPHEVPFKWLGSLVLRLEFERHLNSLETQATLFSAVLKMRSTSERYLLTDFILTQVVPTGLKPFPRMAGFEKPHSVLLDFLISNFFRGDTSGLTPLSKIKKAQDWQVVYTGLKSLVKAVNLSGRDRSEILLNLIGKEKFDYDLFIEEMSLLPTLMQISGTEVLSLTKQGPGSLKKYLVNILENVMGVNIKDYPQFSSVQDLFHKVFEADHIRNPTAIFVFALKIHSLNDEQLNLSLKQFVKSIIKGGNAFRELRYGEGNPNLPHIFKDEKFKENWIRGDTLSLSEFMKTYSKTTDTTTHESIDAFDFFKKKMDEGHLNLQDFRGLRIFADSLKGADKSDKRRAEILELIKKDRTAREADVSSDQSKVLNELDLATLLVQLYGLKSKQQQKTFFDEKIKDHLNLVFTDANASQFKDDLLLFRKSLDEQITFSNLDGFTIEDTDDWQDILLCGLEIQGSCQSINGDPKLMKCLLGYLLGGEVRLILVRHPSKVMVGRSLIRALPTEKLQTEVLYKEGLYNDLRLSSEMETAIDKMFIRRAASLKRDLVKGRENEKTEPPYTEAIQSLGTKAPFMYVDAPADNRQVVPGGKFKIAAEKMTVVYSAHPSSLIKHEEHKEHKEQR